MSCPHFSISIRQRSKRQSAVAGAAYQSGEKLYSEYDLKTKNYNYKINEVLAKGILLPPNAQKEYEDRQTLWNAVENVEKQWNSQLARGIIIALPNEIPKEELEPLVRNYCMEQFVSRGMIADFAIHDKGDGNPHAHVLLTMRALDESGKWLPKAQKVYDLDENGERIRLPSGEWKSHKVNTVDWNDKSNAEIWRSKWAEAVNDVYEKYAIPCRLDLRSFARQGKEEVPTVHLGPAVAHMEEKGISTEIGDYNRKIKEHNNALAYLKKLIVELSEWLKTVTEKFAVLTEKKTPQPTILDFVHAYQNMRKSERFGWSVKGRETAAVKDMKLTSKIIFWIETTGIHTLDDFNAFVSEYNAEFYRLSEIIKSIRRTETALKHINTVISLKPVYDKSKKGFNFIKEKYASDHIDELEKFNKAMRYLKANSLTADDCERFEKEHSSLLNEKEQLEKKLCALNLDPDLISQIKYCIDKVLESGDTPEHKATMIERLKEKTKNDSELKISNQTHERNDRRYFEEL